MNKTVLSIGLILLMGMVLAQAPASNTVYLNEGWNLVTNFIQPSQITGGNIAQSNIKAVYAFVPTTQQYARTYPNPSQSDIALLQSIDDDIIEQNAFWVYTDKAGTLTYTSTASPATRVEERNLYAGWNFVGVGTDMVESPAYPEMTLEDISGNCNVQKAYAFIQGQWVTITPFPMEDTLVNSGILVKVSNNCQLGMAAQTPPAPPATP